MKRFVFILLIFSCYNTYAQLLNNLKRTQIQLSSDTIKFDTLSIVPFSLYAVINDTLLTDTLYSVDYVNALFITKKKINDTNIYITLVYRVFPYNFSSYYFHKKFLSNTNEYNEYSGFYRYQFPKNQTNLLESDMVERRGSISRGISFGNNQDVIVNSSMNLQLAGKITDNLQIIAAISDNNIPIQPDGNSQQLQEFDKVYIQLFNEKNKLIMGDYEIIKPTGTFLNVYKKVQGGSYSYLFNTNEKKKTTVKTTFSGAVAKGTYCRKTFYGKEGIQGPYRISGCNNETFIIILSGTEKVYVDGKLMKRGQEYDYVIDYNSGEITFTPNQLITKDKRIVIEFEYSDKNYARFIALNANELITNKSKFWFNIYTESDNKNQPLQQEISDEEKKILTNVGDHLDLALVPNIDSIAFNNTQVLYKKIDTVINTTPYTIYIYSTNADSAHYRLGFSYVGEGKGNYVPTLSSANGKVYKWVAPISGIAQGNYEPVVLLITPKKKQMSNIGGTMQLTSTTSLSLETAVSNNDLNTFSQKNSNDNVGFAFLVNIKQHILTSDTLKKSLFLLTGYRFVDTYFSEIERFRTIEFERDWNLNVKIPLQTNEHLFTTDIMFTNKNWGKTKYSFNILNQNNVEAYKNNFTTSISKNHVDFQTNISLLNSQNFQHKTQFLRHDAALAKHFKLLTIGVSENAEDNRWFFTNNDSLILNSYAFQEFETYITNADTFINRYTLSYKQRNDQLPLNGKLKHALQSHDIKAQALLLKNNNNSLNSTITYRILNCIDTLLTSQNAENTLTARIEYTANFIKGIFTSETFYEIGSGLEVKKAFSYLEVAQGQGIYAWLDYNNNGIKELNEFEIANFQDQANYIRIYTPTNEYIKTNNNQFNQTFSVMPYKIWYNRSGAKKFIARFNEQFAFRISRKDAQINFWDNINPIGLSIADANLISNSTSFRNTFSFNKTSSIYGVDYTIQQYNDKALLINGFDTKTHQWHGIRLRWNIIKKITLIDDINRGYKTRKSEYFNTNDYAITYYKNDASLSWQPTMNMRYMIKYNYSYKTNTISVEASNNQDLGIEITYNVALKGNLVVNANYISIKYNAPKNSPIAYEMLEGLMPGNNYTWSLRYQRSLSNTLQMNFNYNGRKSKDIKTIHAGGVQLRALF